MKSLSKQSMKKQKKWTKEELIRDAKEVRKTFTPEELGKTEPKCICPVERIDNSTLVLKVRVDCPIHKTEPKCKVFQGYDLDGKKLGKPFKVLMTDKPECKHEVLEGDMCKDCFERVKWFCTKHQLNHGQKYHSCTPNPSQSPNQWEEEFDKKAEEWIRSGYWHSQEFPANMGEPSFTKIKIFIRNLLFSHQQRLEDRINKLEGSCPCGYGICAPIEWVLELLKE